MTARARARLRASLAAVAAAFGNRDLRRLQLAWAGVAFSTWASVIALGVYAFEAGGATAVGLAGLARLLPGALASPFAGLIADRYSRKPVLVASALAGGLVLALAAALAAADAPTAVVFALAGLFTVVISPYVPAEGALLPAIARTPQELSAANVAHSAMDNGGFLLGSLVAGLLLAAGSPALVFGVAASVAIVTVSLLAQVGRDERAAYASEIDFSRAIGHLSVGARLLVRDSALRLLGAALTVIAFFEGAADVLIVILALDLLDLSDGSVGYLNASWGVGALVGAGMLAVLLNRGQLARALAAGSLVIGAAIALPAIWPVPTTAYLGWFGVGIGFTFVEVASRTLMQRLGSDESLGRVLGVMETARLGSTALGASFAPVAVALLGTRGAVVCLAAVVPAFALLRWAALRSYEVGAPVADRPYVLLRADPIFEALPVATVERLSRDAVTRQADRGEEIVTQGQRGECFYVIEEGEVEVLEDGSHRRTQGPGESFGEIALLRDVPRTATVRALRPTRVWSIGRDEFIEAVTGHARGSATAHAIAEARAPTMGED